jgi:hypothetical protein
MAVDKNAPDLRPLRVLLHDRAWTNFVAAIEGPDRVLLESEGIQHYVRTQHMSESDRLLLTLAYSLWRGFGPSIDINALWGMDPAVAARVLASLAAAVDPEAPTAILRHSIELLEGTETAVPTEDAPRPKLAVARE